MNNMNMQELLRALTEPVPQPSNPLRDSRFTEAKAEVSNASSAHAGSVNWERVASLASGVLTESGKDLTLASYVVYIMFLTSGLAGLATGLSAIAELLQSGQIISPSRPVYQKRALQWLLTKVDLAFRSLHKHDVDVETAKLLQSSIRELHTVCGERLGDHSPGLGKYRKFVKEHLERLKLEATPEAHKAASSESSEDSGPETTLPREESSETTSHEIKASAPAPRSKPDAATGDLERKVEVEERATDAPTLSALRKQMARQAAKLREQNPGDPVCYRLMRSACWLEISGPPPTNGVKTHLGGVPGSTWKRLEKLASNSQWAGVLQQCENLILSRPYHLDLHRLSCDALKGMAHIEAYKCLIEEVRNFLRRVPGLFGLQDKTGRQLADTKTVALFQSKQPRAAALKSSAAENVNPEHGSSESSPQDLRVFQERLLRTHSARERFMMRVQLGEGLHASGNFEFALKLFSSLLAGEGSISLQDWEPELFSRGLAGLARAQLAMGIRADDSLAKLVIADAARAGEILEGISGTS